MEATLLALLVLNAPPPSAVETQFLQVAPAVQTTGSSSITKNQQQAVVLIHGLYLNPLNKESALRAWVRNWQKPDSVLVKRLARQSDVFAFAYSQTAPVDELAKCPELDQAVQSLCKAGYHEITLIGYSAGGLIARRYVENRPRCGVNKVVQVCAPNEGTDWAKLVRSRTSFADFVSSLTREGRQRARARAEDQAIPASIQFACVVGTGRINGDGLVALKSQWSEDLQRQGVPAYGVSVSHWQAVRTAKGADLIAELVQRPLPRWNEKEVRSARRQLLGEKLFRP